MKRMFKNKNFVKILVIIILAIMCLFGLTGCNKQIVDLNYSYDKAICKIGDEAKEIEIKKWKDYDGEQLQIVDEEDNAYLVSSVNCTLIKGEE